MYIYKSINEFSHSFPIVLFKSVLTYLSAEVPLSTVVVVTGMMVRIFKIVLIFGNCREFVASSTAESSFGSSPATETAVHFLFQSATSGTKVSASGRSSR